MEQVISERFCSASLRCQHDFGSAGLPLPSRGRMSEPERHQDLKGRMEKVGRDAVMQQIETDVQREAEEEREAGERRERKAINKGRKRPRNERTEERNVRETISSKIRKTHTSHIKSPFNKNHRSELRC